MLLLRRKSFLKRLHKRISSSNTEFFSHIRNIFNYLLRPKISEMYLYKDSSSPPLLFFLPFPFFFLFNHKMQPAKRRQADDSCAVQLKIPKFSNPLFTWIETIRAFSILILGGVAGAAAGDESDREQYRISRAGVLWKFVRAILSIQWSVVSIRSRSRHLCPVSLPPSTIVTRERWTAARCAGHCLL